MVFLKLFFYALSHALLHVISLLFLPKGSKGGTRSMGSILFKWNIWHPPFSCSPFLSNFCLFFFHLLFLYAYFSLLYFLFLHAWELRVRTFVYNIFFFYRWMDLEWPKTFWMGLSFIACSVSMSGDPLVCRSLPAAYWQVVTHQFPTWSFNLTNWFLAVFTIGDCEIKPILRVCLDLRWDRTQPYTLYTTAIRFRHSASHAGQIVHPTPTSQWMVRYSHIRIEHFLIFLVVVYIFLEFFFYKRH